MAAGRKHLLILGAPSREIFRPAERRGLGVVLLTVPELLNEVDLPDGVARVETADLRSADSVAGQIRNLHRGFPLAGITTTFEIFLEPAALAAADLGLPTNPVEAVRNTRDKLRMRQVLEDAGLGQVRFAVCGSVAEAERFLAEVGGPIFVKPTRGTASHGVSRVDRPGELERAFELVSTCLAKSQVLCEEFVPGPEISLEAYSVEGRLSPVAFTDKRIDRHFAEIGHQQPSSHPEEMLRAAAELASEALSSLGVDFGVTHTEFKMTPEPVLVETHTRLASDNIHRLVELTTGVDLLDMMTGLAVGEKRVDRPRPSDVAAAVRWLRGGPGRLRRIRLPELDRDRGLVDVGAKVEPGDRISLRTSGPAGAQLAYVVATDTSPAAASARADRFLEEIEIEFG